MIIVISQIIVLVFGVAILVLAGWGILVPEKIMTLARSTMDRHWGIYVAVLTTLVLGAALIGIAPTSLFPLAFQALGLIVIAAAVALAVAGPKAALESPDVNIGSSER